MKAKLFFLQIFISLSCFSQQYNLDSLRNEYRRAANDTVRLEILKKIAEESFYNDSENYKNTVESLLSLAEKTHSAKYMADGNNGLGRYYHRIGEAEKSKKYYLKAFSQFRKIEDHSGMAKAYGNIAAVYIDRNQMDSSLFYLKKAISINKKYGFNENLFFNYYNLGLSESLQNNYEEAIINIHLALRYAEKLNNSRYIAYCNSMIGVQYLEQEMFDDAEEFLHRAEGNFTAIGDVFGLAQQYVNLGKLYNERDKDYYKAIQHYKKAAYNYKQIGDTLNGSIAVGNIGRNFIELGNLDSAKVYIRRSLNFSRDANNPDELVRSLTNMGEIEFRKQNLVEAKQYIDSALSISKEHRFLEDYGQALLILSDINASEADYKSAYNNLIAFQEINDSIKSAETKEMIVDISTKYQTEKKEKENLALQQQNAQQALLTEKEKTQKTVMAGGLAVSLAALGIFFFVYRKNQKQKREIEKQKDLVEKLQRELHHRLKNNLSFIDFFITLAKGKFPDPAYRAKLDELQNRINSMFEVHKQLYRKEDVTSVNARTYISALVENVRRAYSNPNISLEEHVADTPLRADTSFPIGLIVNEFVTNSYKYAFPNDEKGTISIKLQEEKDRYLLRLSDTGKGLPPDFNIDSANSFGMETIKLLTHEYKGSFRLDGSKGLSMDITFPKSAA